MYVKHKEDKLETLFRERQKQIINNDMYSRFMFAPIIVIVVSIVVILCNFTAGKLPMSDTGGKRMVLSQTDNSRSYIVPEDETGKGSPLKTQSEVNQDKINLNTASAQQLDALPEIGPARACEIVRLRQQMGGFRTVEDILNAKGIGEKVLENIRDKVFVEWISYFRGVKINDVVWKQVYQGGQRRRKKDRGRV